MARLGSEDADLHDEDGNHKPEPDWSWTEAHQWRWLERMEEHMRTHHYVEPLYALVQAERLFVRELGAEVIEDTVRSENQD